MASSVDTLGVDPAPETRVKITPLSYWLAILGLSMGGFAIGLSEFSAMSMLQEICRSFSIDLVHGRWHIATYALGVVIGAPLIAIFTARVDRKKLVMCLLMVYVVGNVATALAWSYPSLLVARFFSGLIHGTYFGVASLIAVHLSTPERKSRSISYVLTGLSLATMIGVPAVQALITLTHWQICFILVAVVSATAVIIIGLCVPPTKDIKVNNPLSELAVIKTLNVWLTLGIGVVGFGGMFAIYTYIEALYGHAHASRLIYYIGLSMFGCGMVTGSILGGKLVDYKRDPTLIGALAAQIIILLLVNPCSWSEYALVVLTFLVGVTGGIIGLAIQTRLIDVSPRAPTLAASLNHSALNIANSAGAYFAGLSIPYAGIAGPSYVGAALAAGGLVIALMATIYSSKSVKGIV